MYQPLFYNVRVEKEGGASSDAPVVDLRRCLELQVGKHGEVITEYGGFEIVVNDPAFFPWYDVIATLLKYDYSVWVTLKKNKLVIVAGVHRD
ncbi:hypothetical protein HRbin01_01113 [archaeon HR01]|nr:hypothetical protein HRbin01_01113 [archaeon HR01]